MDPVRGNVSDLKWMERFTKDGVYRGRKKLWTGEGATLQIMEFCNGHPINPHKHFYEQITMVLQGEADFYVDGVAYRMTAGSYLVIPPETEHYIHVYDSSVPCINFDVFVPARHEYANEYAEFMKAQLEKTE